MPEVHFHSSASRQQRLWLAFALTLAMMVIEVIGGMWSGSLALLTDAAHMLVDAFALGMAVISAHIAGRPADNKRSYGYQRMEVLSGFTNAVLQGVLIIFILVHALIRLFAPVEILSGVMFWVAVAGLLINIVVLLILGGHHHHHDDVNMAGAALHVLGDLLGSVAAIVAALMIYWWGFVYADPILSILVSLLILRSAWSILRHAAHILLEGVPEGLRMDDIQNGLQGLHPDILDVHHLHLWQLGAGSRMATLHVTLASHMHEAAVIALLKEALDKDHQVGHTTIQIEVDVCPDEGAAKTDTP